MCRCAQQQAQDLILLDVIMTGMDGYQVQQALAHLADLAMYQAKENGRNQVRLFLIGLKADQEC